MYINLLHRGAVSLQSLHESGNSIIGMICCDCEAGFQDLFYKHIAAAPNNLLTILLHDFKEKSGNLWIEISKFSTSTWETPVRFFRVLKNDLSYRDNAGTNCCLGFYVENNRLPETEVWMSEGGEMKSFLNPESNLGKDGQIVCEPEKFDDTVLNRLANENFFTSSLQPYVLQEAPESYAGWYNMQGCGKCNDWCR